MSLRSLEEQSSELHRREDIEDREQAERESGDGFLHGWEDEGTDYRLVSAYSGLACLKRVTTGKWGIVYYATPLMREILRLRDQGATVGKAGYLEGLRVALEAARAVRVNGCFGSQVVEEEIESLIAEAGREEDG